MRYVSIVLITAWMASSSLAADPTTRSAKDNAGSGTLGKRLEYMRRLGKATARAAKHTDEAMAIVREAEVSDPMDPAISLGAAEAAFVLDAPRTAIGILERLIQSRGGDKTPGMKLPIAVSANFRIGTVARYSGDSKRAIKAYEAAMEAADKMQGNGELKAGLRAIALLYVAEIHEAQQRPEQAARVLDQVVQMAPAVNDRGLPVDLYKDWAGAKLTSLQQQDREAAMAARRSPPQPWMLVVTQLDLAGLVDAAELDRYADEGDLQVSTRICQIVLEANVSAIDRALVRVLYGNQREQKGDYDGARRLYDAAFNEPSFLSLDGGAGSIRCLVASGRAEEAAKMYERVVAKCPKSAASLKTLLRPKK